MQRILNRRGPSRIIARNTVCRRHLAVRTNVLGDQTHKFLRQLVCLDKCARQIVRAIGKRGIGRPIASDHPAQRSAQRAYKGARATAAGNRLTRGKRLGKSSAGFIHHLLAHRNTSAHRAGHHGPHA